jgi:HSP20 family protein
MQMNRFGNRHRDPFHELNQMEREFNMLFGGQRFPGTDLTPPVNMGATDETITIRVELPGIDTRDLDISIAGKTLTLKGSRKNADLKNGEHWHNRERAMGDFKRVLELPYPVAPEKTEANYSNGILSIVMERMENDKPKKIKVSAP